jgi:hypothetical protein
LILVLAGLACFVGVIVMASTGLCGDQPLAVDVALWALFAGGFVATAAGVYRVLRLGDAARAAIGFLVASVATVATFIVALLLALAECVG